MVRARDNNEVSMRQRSERDVDTQGMAIVIANPAVPGQEDQSTRSRFAIRSP